MYKNTVNWTIKTLFFEIFTYTTDKSTDMSHYVKINVIHIDWTLELFNKVLIVVL